MDSENISKLHFQLPATITHNAAEAAEKDVEFLAFRQLNKRARVRLSALPFTLEHMSTTVRLLAFAHTKGWFAAVVQVSITPDFAVAFGTLSDLRNAFISTEQSQEIFLTPKRVLKAFGVPNIVTFTVDHLRMLLSFTDGRILLYDTSALFSAGSNDIPPLHSWPSSPFAAQQILPNPGDMPHYLAILLGPGAPQPVMIFDAQRCKSVAGWEVDPTSDPVATISWSPKGKQLAIGLKSGAIAAFSPADTAVPRLTAPSPAFPTPLDLVSLGWLANDTFHGIYASSSPDIDHTHLILIVDSKAGAMEEIKLNTPYFLLPDIPPKEYIVTLKNWEPSKTTLIVGASASSDIGVIGKLDDAWYTFALEETATPRMPLDSNGNETMLVALDVDLSNNMATELNVAGDTKHLSSCPILYAFASDGTIQGWYILNTSGIPYPCMIQQSQSSHPLGSPQHAGRVLSPNHSPIIDNPSPMQPSTFHKAALSVQSSSAFSNVLSLASGTASEQKATSGQVTSPVSAFGRPSSFQSPFNTSSPSIFANTARPAQAPTFGQSSFQSKYQSSGDTSQNVQMGFPATPLLSKTQPTNGGFAAFAKGGAIGLSGNSPAPGSTKNEPGTSFFGGSDALVNQSPSGLIKPGFLATTSLSPAPFSTTASIVSNPLAPSALSQATNSQPAFPGSSPIFGSTSVLGAPKSATSLLGVSKASTPVFGATSMVGNSQSTFGKSSIIGGTGFGFGNSQPTQSAQSQTQPPKNIGFGAFSGSVTGFGSAAGGQKSFGELLREKSNETSESHISGSKAATYTTPVTEVDIPSLPPSNTESTSTPTESIDINDLGPEAVKAESGLSMQFPSLLSEGEGIASSATTAIPHPGVEVRERSGIQKELSTHTSDQSLSDSFSFSSLNSSFVDVLEANSLRKDDEADELEDDRPSSPDTLSDHSESPDDHQSSHEDRPSTSPTPEPAIKIPVPAAPRFSDRSLSTTPKPEVPAIRAMSIAPSLSPAPSAKLDPAFPSPVRTSPLTPDAAASTPAPVPGFSAPPQSTLGLGRPSSRPSRSSPLASTHISLQGATQPGAKQMAPSAIKVQPASHKLLFGQWSQPTTGIERPEGLKSSRSNPERAHSPPLFFGDPVKLASSATMQPKSSPATPAPPVSQAERSPFKPLIRTPDVNNTPNLKSRGPVESPQTVSVEQGMQLECLHLFATLGRELENLKILAQNTAQKREAINRGSPAINGGNERPSLRDITQLGGKLRHLPSDLSSLRQLRIEHAAAIRALRGQMLKAGTRKEEVVRFHRAKTDNEFAVILRERTLGPDHLEAQNQLRKDVRAMRDRIRKLEDKLYASKKRLEQLKSGKPSISAPSMDTIGRTYRNIDIAISQQSQDIARLTSRMTELNLNAPSRVTVTRDKRLPDIISRRPFNITPNVAVTTAAALNAERSAQKLKRALLAARKQPCVNTKAAETPTPSIAFTPPRSMLPSQLGGPSPINIGAQRPMFNDSDLLFDDISASPSTSPSPLPARRTRIGVKHHNKPIALPRTGANRGSPAATNFDWGPLPTVTPMRTISDDVRKRDSPGGT